MPTTVGDISIDLGCLDRIQASSREAQKLLNMQVVADMEPLVPFRQGALLSNSFLSSSESKELSKKFVMNEFWHILFEIMYQELIQTKI